MKDTDYQGIIEALICKEKIYLIASLNSAIECILPVYHTLEKQGKKQCLQNIYISFLKTGVLHNTAWMQLDFYDSRNLLDLVECSVDWDISIVSSRLYRDYPLTKVPGQQEMDLHKVQCEHNWLAKAFDYSSAFASQMPILIEHSKLSQMPDVNVYFGEYLGKTELVKGRSGSEIL